MADDIDDLARTAAARTALTSAYEEAAALVEGITDGDLAYEAANVLIAALEGLLDQVRNKLRPRLLLRLRDQHELDVVRLAARVSRPGHPIGKSNVHRLLQIAENEKNEEAA